MMNYKKTEFFELKGKTLKSMTQIREIVEVSDTIGECTTLFELKTIDDEVYRIAHFQDCCEHVDFYTIIGNLENALNSPITLAEDELLIGPRQPIAEDYFDHSTLNAYHISTAKGAIELQFIGSSRGYDETTTVLKAV